MALRHLLSIALFAILAFMPPAAAQSEDGKARAFQQGWYQEASKEIRAHLNQGALDKALARNAEVLERVAREFGPASFDAAIVISTEGHIYSGSGKFAEAIGAYERSLALMLVLFGPAHGQVAIMHANIARCYAGQTRTAEAKARCSRRRSPWRRGLMARKAKPPGRCSTCSPASTSIPATGPPRRPSSKGCCR